MMDQMRSLKDSRSWLRPRAGKAKERMQEIAKEVPTQERAKVLFMKTNRREKLAEGGGETKEQRSKTRRSQNDCG